MPDVFGGTFGPWHEWFAWFPVDTKWHGWKWLTKVERRRYRGRFGVYWDYRKLEK